MYSLAQVANGANAYISSEIVEKLSDWRKWVVGAAAELLVANMAGVFNKLKTNELVKLLGVIDENDNIDVDKLYKHFKSQAQRGSITFNVPMIGAMTLNEGDVDAIYRHIRNGGASI